MSEQTDDPGGSGGSKPRYGSSGDDASGGGSSGGGSRGGGVRPPRDEFVGKLVSDPANLDEKAPAVLQGYIGDSDEDGYTRVYCGPSLDVYADVKDDDILHFEASDDGCEHTLWARADAQVKHGRRGQAKGEASSFFEGPLRQDFGGAAGGGAPGGGGAQITLQTVNGCNIGIGYTGWHYCTIVGCPTQPMLCPLTLVCIPPTLDCPQQGAGAQPAAANVGPTGWQGCTQPGHCVGPTGWQGCTQADGCPGTSTCPPQGGQALGAAAAQTINNPTAATHCFICPPITRGSPYCPIGAAQAGAPGAQQSTAATVCTQIGCGPHTIGYTGWYGCNTPTHTTATVCTQVGCPPRGTGSADAVGITGWYGCHTPTHTLATVCTLTGCGPHTIGHTGWYGCHTPTHTLATVCTQIGCGHTHLLGCPSSSTCPPQAAAQQSTAATQCTHAGCGHPIGPTGWHGCTHAPGCPISSTCPPNGTVATVGHGCVGHTGWYGCQG